MEPDFDHSFTIYSPGAVVSPLEMREMVLEGDLVGLAPLVQRAEKVALRKGDAYEQTLLHHAASRGNQEIVEFLLAAVKDDKFICRKDLRHRTAADMARIGGHVRLCDVLSAAQAAAQARLSA